MMGGPGFGPMRLHHDIKDHKVRPGTFRRIIPYAMRHRWSLLTAIMLTALHAAIAALTPVFLKFVIDDGIVPRNYRVIIGLSVLIAVLALVDAAAMFLQTWFSGRVGQGLLYDLRSTLFAHIQRQSLAFFTRTQTGALVSRLNADVVGAQQAVANLLSQIASTVLTLVLGLAAMFYLSWQITLVVLVIVPIFLLPTKAIGRTLQRLARGRMQLDAQLATMMNERFNVAGATLAKLYGEPAQEAEEFDAKAGRVRDVSTTVMVYGQLLGICVTLLASLATAIVYGLGGALTIHGAVQIGTLVALVNLLGRVYGPINMLSNMQVSVMTALVSFDRLFEILDLQPLIQERPGAHALTMTGATGTTAPTIEFDGVSFRYPNASDVSVASLESISLPAPERSNSAWALREVSFQAPAGKLTALVGPSGAGKTTITQLVPRLYEATSGAVRIGGEDVRDLTQRSLHSAIGVVTQDAYLFHDTIRANLMYARRDATEREVIEACEAARIWDVISSLPDGLDTIVGDRGHRLSGGEKQRVALARLLLKSPPIVVLDEATAHLDSESEAAIQSALHTALHGRTSLVIAHRLSTIREAHQILVVDGGEIKQRGTHDELLATGGLYADLYRIQFGLRSGEYASATSTLQPRGRNGGSSSSGRIAPR
jgi:ATP-binding cassette, subfamily B, bacterial